VRCIHNSHLGIGARLRFRYRLAINAFWAIPATLIMRLTHPLFHIRICSLQSDRIGHFVPDTAEHLGRRNFRKKRTIDLFYLRGPISNLQWALMAKRSYLKIFGDWLSYVDTWNRLIPGGERHELRSSLTESRDIQGFFQNFDCSVPFLESETNICEEWLMSKGWRKGEPFVTVLVRDSAYLNSTNSNIDWSYHSYRNSNIETYVPALEWLDSQGVWVLRMGKTMSCPIPTNSKRIIDYAFDPKRSDLLDIWLFANSVGIISTSSGLDVIGSVYRKPLLYLNASPISDFGAWDNAIWVPKNLKWVSNQKPLTLYEYLSNRHLTTEAFDLAGIRLIDLTEKEILSAAVEFWQRITGVWEHRDNEQELQEACWAMFKLMPYFENLYGWKNPESRIGYNWLLSRDADFFTL
jgi:putative glycosyltransferase (TIGR04372 family)